MNTAQKSAPHQHLFANQLNILYRALIAAPVVLEGRTDARTARLLSSLLLIMIAFFAAIDLICTMLMPGYQLLWQSYILFGCAYVLTRTQFIRLAIWGTITAFPLTIILTMLTDPAQALDRTIQYLILSLFVAVIFVSWRGLIVVTAIHAVGLLLLPFLLPDQILDPLQIVTLLSVNTLGAMLALLCIRHREKLEWDRQAELRASEDRYRIISNLVSDYALAYRIHQDGSAELEWITDAFTRITGYTQEEMRTSAAWAQLVYPDDRLIAAQHSRRILNNQSTVCEYRVIARDGRILWLRFYDQPVWDQDKQRVVRVYGAVQDITSIRHLEHQLSQAQKMEAIGQLAGEVAHDFNNLLTVILGNTALLLEADPDRAHARGATKQIQRAAQQATLLTRQLLSFSRKQILTPCPLNLNQVLNDQHDLLCRLLGKQISMVMRLAPELGLIRADLGQIEQVIMNIVMNARDAMPNGGTLTIATANTVVRSMPTEAHVGAVTGPFVILQISDTGIGMDAATRARIFEPFFTTKPNGKGTGLGLPMALGIITRNGGHINIESEPGQGTTFTIYLPQIEE